MTCYVALDGPDGCGKSTQAMALVAWLEAEGADVLHVREPGSTPVGEALRELLLSPQTGELRGLTEVLLFSAARAELIERVVAPARASNKLVIAERCFLSTAVYQLLASDPAGGGAAAAVRGKGESLAWFEDLTRRVHGACLPDAVFVLDVPPHVARSRRQRRSDEDRIEARGDAYHERVRNGFLQLAEREPRAHVVDASRTFEQVQGELQERMRRFW
ncbi:MAG: dTMP kinase [Planctomycetota bacterium]